jgi:hypothetical protein
MLLANRSKEMKVLIGDDGSDCPDAALEDLERSKNKSSRFRLPSVVVKGEERVRSQRVFCK